MHATPCLLGIDVGTSALKALLLDMQGRLLASRSQGYPLHTPRPGWTEQDPEDWWQAVLATVPALLAAVPGAQVKAIGLSGQMHGLVPLDEAMAVIRPAILWNDQRSVAQCAAMTEAAGGLEALLALTGNPMLTGYTGSKIAWLRDAEPERFGRLRHALNPKDHLRLRLTGELATDVSDASGTGLFDIQARRWSGGLLERIGIDPDLLPQAFESSAVTGRLRAQVAHELGLPAGIPVVAGGGDAVIQTTGSGVVTPGVIQTTLGTGGILACALTAPVGDGQGRLQLFCNNAPDLWHCMGVSLCGGASLAWLRQTLTQPGGQEPAWSTLTDAAAAVPSGSEGLLFLPYLAGERCPHPDADARGSFIGLTLRHGYGHMARSVMEGAVMALRDMLELMRPALGQTPHRVVASGGGAQSPLWRQIQADLLDCETVTVSGAAEGGAFGAALVAGVGIGCWPGLAEAVGSLTVETTTLPQPESRAALAASYAVWRDLYPVLAPQFRRIAALPA